MFPPARRRSSPCLFAASICALIAATPVQAASSADDSLGIAWDCTQSHDAAYQVVCRPACPIAANGAASVPNEPANAAVQPLWGRPTTFRSMRTVAAIPDGTDSDASAATCSLPARPRTESAGKVAAAPHAVPVTERATAEIFSGRPWRVPLFARPTDPGAVTRLLREVLCGDAACVVTYHPAASASLARYP